MTPAPLSKKVPVLLVAAPIERVPLLLCVPKFNVPAFQISVPLFTVIIEPTDNPRDAPCVSVWPPLIVKEPMVESPAPLS